MVSIVGQESPSDMVSKIVAQGIQQNLPRGLEQSRNRGMLQQSLEEINRLGQNPSQNPLELMTSIMKAGAGIPGSEKYLGQLYPLIMQQMQGQNLGQLPQPGQGNVESQAQNGQQQFSQQQNVIAGRERLPLPIPEATDTPYGEASSGIDLGQGPIPKTHSPEAYRQVNSQYRAKGLDPTPAIQQMEKEDEVARNQLQDMIKGAQTVSALSELRAAEQQREKDALAEKMPGLSPSEMTVAEKIAQTPEMRKIKNNSIRADHVKKEYDLYKKGVDSFKGSAERSNYDPVQYDRQIKDLGEYAKDMVKWGQRDEAERILADSGWGPVERSKILNPLDQKVKQGIEKLPKFRPLDESITVLADDPRFDIQAKKALENKNKSIDEYSKFIVDNFKTGSYEAQNAVTPGTSLLQLREDAMKNGMEWQDFSKMITDLVRKGEITLDKYQSAELKDLAQSPEKSFGIGEIIWRLNPLYKGRK